MNTYEVVAALLWILACTTGVVAFLKGLDRYVNEYAHDIRKGLD